MAEQEMGIMLREQNGSTPLVGGIMGKIRKRGYE